MTTNGTSTRSKVRPGQPIAHTRSSQRLPTLAKAHGEHGRCSLQVGDDGIRSCCPGGRGCDPDAAGNEITRQGPSNFLGELNLLSGQSVFVTAVVTKPLRYIAVDRKPSGRCLFDDGARRSAARDVRCAPGSTQQVARLAPGSVIVRRFLLTTVLAFAQQHRFADTGVIGRGDQEAAALVAD
jgi:hypothetical protein